MLVVDKEVVEVEVEAGVDLEVGEALVSGVELVVASEGQLVVE